MRRVSCHALLAPNIPFGFYLSGYWRSCGPGSSAMGKYGRHLTPMSKFTVKYILSSSSGKHFRFSTQNKLRRGWGLTVRVCTENIEVCYGEGANVCGTNFQDTCYERVQMLSFLKVHGTDNTREVFNSRDILRRKLNLVEPLGYFVHLMTR